MISRVVLRYTATKGNPPPTLFKSCAISPLSHQIHSLLRNVRQEAYHRPAYVVFVEQPLKEIMAARPDDLAPLTDLPSPADAMRRIPPATAEDIEAMADQAADILKEAVAAALEPQQRKVLRKLEPQGGRRASRGSRKTLERGIDEGKLPGGEPSAAAGDVYPGGNPQDPGQAGPEDPGATRRPIPRSWSRSRTSRAVWRKTSTAIHLGQYFALQRLPDADDRHRRPGQPHHPLRPASGRRYQASQTLAP